MKGKGMSVIVKTVAAVIAVPLIVFALYIMLHGHLTPGGGFPGGAILASLAALYIAAFGMQGMKAFGKGWLAKAESIGLAFFAGLAFLGIGATFLHNFLANSGSVFGEQVAFGANPGALSTAGLIPLMNIAVGLEVFAAVSLILVAMHAGGRG